MVPENLTPLEELRQLGQRSDRATSLSDLQPLFARLEEIVRSYAGDFEVQVVAHDIRQQILTRGSELRRLQPRPVIPTPPLEAPLGHKPPHEMPPAAPMPDEKQPRKRGPVIAWTLAAILLLVGVGIAISVIRDRNARTATLAPVNASITTIPTGAQIKINGQESCKSDCVARLAPGTYKVDAIMDGYEIATSDLKIVAEQPASLKLMLAPQSPGIRVIAEMNTGEVFLDDQRAGELQDGLFMLDRVMPGKHTLRVAGPSNQASFAFDVAPGAAPLVDGPITTKELLAAVVGSKDNSAKLTISGGPLKLMTNGEDQGEATPEGVDLVGYQVGANDLTLTDKTKKRTMSATFPATPMLTVFLKSDQNIGTLLISTGGENGVHVFVNNRENRKQTERGELRVQAFGKVNVRVEKPGFDPVPPQTVTIAKGEEKKLDFVLKETPKFGTLAIAGGTPGAEVLLNQRVIGAISQDGSFRNASIGPGDHTIELRAEQHEPKKFTRAFRAGQIVLLTAAEAVLATVRVAPPPPPPTPPPVVVTPPPAPKPAPKPVEGDISDFDNKGAWREQDGIWRHKGAGTLTYTLTPNGIFTFSIYMLKGGITGGKVRWVVNYVDSKNYALFELDEKTFWVKFVRDGKTTERKRVSHGQDKELRVWNIQLDVSPQRIVSKIQDENDRWKELDSWTDTAADFTKGKFGILVNGNDEVGLSNFKFTGK